MLSSSRALLFQGLQLSSRAGLRPLAANPFSSQILVARRSMSSIFDRFTGKMVERNEEKAKENFASEMEKMLKTEKFDLKHFISELDSGLSSWRAKAANLTGSNEDLKTLQETKAMLESIQFIVGNRALNSRSLDRRNKIAIAAKAGKNVNDINVAVDSFMKMQSMHRWLQDRKKRGEPMPKSQEEAQELMQLDMQNGKMGAESNASYIKQMKKKQKRLASRRR
ncbi:hypothetical protein TrLO_g7657 [Triparma laevis f. longispina]|uniref:Signal recognition particle SRP54 subunit M-domain domain-containing protein n=1 Tax=Triparma laevis f. longispina TaxID=1714387 RepID=A0A9W7CGK9_9STRA|nr:hypothetical protein TrLO_g7657 [Triparma laevis f. longispina]